MGDLTSSIGSDTFEPSMITVTDSAVKQLKNLIEENPTQNSAKGIRLFVQTGGCCKDPHYGMALDQQRDGDEILDRDGVQFLIDPASTEKLRGSIVDFHDGPEGVGFRIQNSAPPQEGCGCRHEEDHAEGHGHSHHHQGGTCGHEGESSGGGCCHGS